MFVGLQGYIVVNNSWNLMFDRYKMDIVRRKGSLVMFVWRHPRDLTWNRRYPPSHVIWLVLLSSMKWQSKRRFCFVQVDQTYQPWHKWHSLPACGPYLETSNNFPNKKVNSGYKGQCSRKEPFTTSGGEIHWIDQPIYMVTSSSKGRWERLGGRQGPSIGSIAQHTI